ncbi:MAG: TrkA family potassium uptake protein, partial [Anaerolineales bacterium]
RQEQLATLYRDLPESVVALGDGADPGVLESNGVRTANVVAAVTGADETNLVVATLARFEFAVPRVIARVNNPKNAWLFTPQMGVDVALNQAELMARLVAEEMSLGDMMTLLKLRKGLFSIVEEKVHPASPAVGKAIGDLRLPEDCVLIAVIRKGDLVLPKGNTVLQPADEVVALISSQSMGALAALLSPTQRVERH